MGYIHDTSSLTLNISLVFLALILSILLSKELYQFIIPGDTNFQTFSEANRIGIGTFAPSDLKSQDIADLTGSIDFPIIGEYGSESDPRAYRFDGELNKAYRGMMEFQEMLKCDEKFLWNLLSLTQEGNFKAGDLLRKKRKWKSPLKCILQVLYNQ